MEGEELATAVLLSPTRDPAKNGEIAQRWMEMVLGEKFRTSFPAVLLSGELLCDLANKVFRALGMSDEVVAEKMEPSDASNGAPSEAAQDNVRKYLRCERDRRGSCIPCAHAFLTVSLLHSACEAIGVAREDLFMPDDLLQAHDIGRGTPETVCQLATDGHVGDGDGELNELCVVNLLPVYRNILALQCVAVSMSSRRSIDERSSLVGMNVMVREQWLGRCIVMLHQQRDARA